MRSVLLWHDRYIWYCIWYEWNRYHVIAPSEIKDPNVWVVLTKNEDKSVESRKSSRKFCRRRAPRSSSVEFSSWGYCGIWFAESSSVALGVDMHLLIYRSFTVYQITASVKWGYCWWYLIFIYRLDYLTELSFKYCHILLTIYTLVHKSDLNII